jgi:hypothetical protein
MFFENFKLNSKQLQLDIHTPLGKLLDSRKRRVKILKEILQEVETE